MPLTVLAAPWRSIGADRFWHVPRDLKLLIILRMVRLVAFGGTTLILALYLHALGFSDFDVGTFMTLTLIGDLAISFGLTFRGDVLGLRRTGVLAGLLMVASGLAFAYCDNYWLLLCASIIGVINPSANEIDPFKAVEESAIARLSPPEDWNILFAWWSMLGMLGTAASNLATGHVIDLLQQRGFGTTESYRFLFLAYAGIGVLKILLCLQLSAAAELPSHGHRESSEVRNKDVAVAMPSETEPLLGDRGRRTPPASCAAEDISDSVPDSDSTTTVHSAMVTEAKGGDVTDAPTFQPESRRFMVRLCIALFFDFVGSGLAQISWMTYFFQREFDVAEGTIGTATFAAGIVSSVLNLASSPLSNLIGQVNTMVVCHTVNSISLLMVAVPGNRTLALALFIFRIVTREIDNAPRQAFISAGVRDDERTAAMSVVNIVKTLGSCVGMYATGIFAGFDRFGFAFISAGCLKLVYNAFIVVFFYGHQQPVASKDVA